MICPNCKNEIDDDSKFCRFCGAEFIGEETVLDIEPESSSENIAGRNVTIHSEMTAGAEKKKKPPKNKKTVLIQLLVTLAVLLVILGALIAVGVGSGKIGVSRETVTDAEGEEIKEGRGTAEMSVKDTDGAVRIITTDKSLLTPEAILNEYTAVVNKLKTDSPSFTKTRYQLLPTDKQNLGTLAKVVLPIIEKYVTSKEAAAPVKYQTGNADKLPLVNSSYGCLLTDSTKIKNAYCEILDDGSYRLVITVCDEMNPQSLSMGATSTGSAVNGMFDPYDAAPEISSIAELALSDISFNYTDCTVSLVYDNDAKSVSSLTQTMYIDITADAYITELQARVTDITEYTDFIY